MDGVADASVVAVPDKFFGETVGTFVRRAPSEAGRQLTREAIRKYVSEHTRQGAPSWIWFLGEESVPEDYPATGSGKIRKIELRNWVKRLMESDIGRVGPQKREFN